MAEEKEKQQGAVEKTPEQTRIDREMKAQREKSQKYVTDKAREKLEKDSEYAYLNKTTKELRELMKKSTNREEFTKWPDGFETTIKKIMKTVDGELLTIINSNESHQTKIKQMEDFRLTVAETIVSFKEGERKEISLEQFVVLRRAIEQYQNVTSESDKFLKSIMFERKVGTLSPETWQQMIDLLEPGIFMELPKENLEQAVEDEKKKTKDDAVKESISQTGGVLTLLEKEKKTENSLDLNEKANLLSMSLTFLKPRQKYEFAYRVLKSEKKEMFPQVLDFMLKGAHLEIYQGKELARIAIEEKACDPGELAKVVNYMEDGTYEKFYAEVIKQNQEVIKKLKTRPYRNEALQYLSVPGIIQGAGVVYSIFTMAGNFFAAFDIHNLPSTFHQFFTNPRVYSAAVAGVASYDALTGRRGLGTGKPTQYWYREERKHEKAKEELSTREKQFVDIYFNHPELANFFTNNFERIKEIKKQKDEKIRLGDIPRKEGMYGDKYTKITYEDIKNYGYMEGFKEKFDSMERAEWQDMLNYMFHTAADEKLLKIDSQNVLKKRIEIYRERYMPSNMDKYLEEQKKIWQ